MAHSLSVADAEYDHDPIQEAVAKINFIKKINIKAKSNELGKGDMKEDHSYTSIVTSTDDCETNIRKVNS